MGSEKQDRAELVTALEDAAVAFWMSDQPTEARKIEKLLWRLSPGSGRRIGGKIEEAFEARRSAA